MINMVLFFFKTKPGIIMKTKPKLTIEAYVSFQERFDRKSFLIVPDINESSIRETYYSKKPHANKSDIAFLFPTLGHYLNRIQAQRDMVTRDTARKNILRYNQDIKQRLVELENYFFQLPVGKEKSTFMTRLFGILEELKKLEIKEPFICRVIEKQLNFVYLKIHEIYATTTLSSVKIKHKLSNPSELLLSRKFMDYLQSIIFEEFLK